MRIGIIGAGGIGGVVGGLLSKAGHDVTLIDQWPEHIEAIKRNGLTVETPDAKYHTTPAALYIHELQGVNEPFDAGFVAVKAYDTEWAAWAISNHVPSDGVVVDFQNGINDDRVAAVVGEDRTLGCVITISAACYEPGKALRTDRNLVGFKIGELDGSDTPRARELVEAMNGVAETHLTTNLWGERWSKLMINCMNNALAGLTGYGTAKVRTEPDTRRIGIHLGAEVVRVAKAHGHTLEPALGVSPDAMVDAAEGRRVEEVESQIMETARRAGDAAGRPCCCSFPSWPTVVVGTLLLMLPFATASGESAPFLTAFFTATSAVTTTGLTLTVTATYWNGFGQAVIAVLIFVGGLGFMTGVTFLLLLIGHRLSLPQHLVVREALSVEPLGGLVRLTRHVFVLDVVITAAGIPPLWWSFSHYYDAPEALWQATFHSISAFNTAGFDIVGPLSLVPFASDYLLLIELTAIACLGAISYTVLLQMFGRRWWKSYTLDTKIVLTVSIGLWAVGSALASMFTLAQHALPIDAGTGLNVFTAFYNSVSAATTTGFSTIDFSLVADSVLIVTIALMFIGGATGSTAGGIKVNTFAVLAIAVCSFLRGRNHAELSRREIPFSQVNRALTITAVGVVIAFVSVLALALLEPDIPAVRLVFEALSALGTVGLSAGVLPQLSTAGVAVIIVLMFVGRMGVLSLIVVLAPSGQPETYRFPQEAVKIG